MDLCRVHTWRVLTQAGRVPQTGTRTEMGSWSDLPHRRVAPAQSVHQLHREPMSAVGKERGHRRLGCPSCHRLSWRGQKGSGSGQGPPGHQEARGGLGPRASACVCVWGGVGVSGSGGGRGERGTGTRVGNLMAHFPRGPQPLTCRSLEL